MSGTVPAIPIWLGLVVAFSLLLTVSVATFFMALGLLNTQNVAVNPVPDKQPLQNVRKDDAVIHVKQPDPFVNDMLNNAAKNFAQPVDKDGHGIRVVLKDLDQEANQKRLVSALKQDVGVWFDVPVKNNLKAVDRFNAAFQKNGLKVVVDKTARATLINAKSGNKDNKYLLYVENLRAEELTSILQMVANGEGEADAATFDRVVIRGMADGDRIELASAMKLPVKDVTPGKAGNMVNFQPFIDEGPITQSGKPSLVVSERLVVVLPFTGSSPAASPELKRFLDNRYAPRQGTLQVVFIVYEAQ